MYVVRSLSTGDKLLSFQTMEDTFTEVGSFACKNHPRKLDKVIQYGTAGFRTKAGDLDHVMFRMGVLAALRSKVKKAVIGVMITASHNPECDNGVKLVDPLGEMLEFSWEKYATELVNVSDTAIPQLLLRICKETSCIWGTKAKVFVARDTRSSSPSLSQSVINGVKLIGDYVDYCLLTTPQLHFMVRCHNTDGEYGTATEHGYYQKLSNAFLKLNKEDKTSSTYSNTLYVDGANGIGALKLKQMLSLLQNQLGITIVNDGTQGLLNHQCGADYVKVEQQAPEGMVAPPMSRCASFDGDADRIVYYYTNNESKFNLLDGDKIATLVAGYLQELVTRSGLQLKLGLVQTAYANGSSTDYITNCLNVPVACVPTGVKHLHHKAQDYDIGVYFEANGHGTVLFSDDAILKISNATSEGGSDLQAASQLSNLVDLINQTVGDAISDMLLVETILRARDWSVLDWNNAYTDLPNRQLKVKVKDRTAIQTTDAERRTTAPLGLQEAVDQIVNKYKKGRSFVRPSGTEDVVRVYAEADTQTDADGLANEVAGIVHDLAGGVGERP